MLKGSILQEDKMILNVYVSNNTASNNRGQKLIGVPVEIDESTIIAGDFNHTSMRKGQFSRQKNQ